MKTFVNFTNHPAEMWESKQRGEAEKYGAIIDIAFPQVDPKMTNEDITEMSKHYESRIIKCNPEMVLCQGEFTLCFAVVESLKEKGIKVAAACSRRIVKEEGDKKIVRFEFEGFREY